MSVVNLHPATTYHFRIVAENGVGLSKPSDPVTIVTSEEGKISKPYLPYFIFNTLIFM